MKRIFLWLGGILLLPVSCQPLINVGKNPAGEDLSRIEALPNYRNGQFQNLESLPGSTSNAAPRRVRWTSFLKFFLGRPAYTRPGTPVPAVITDLHQAVEKPTVVWFGHSSFLLKTRTANILFDPNFSGFAGPFSGLINAFPGTNVYDERHMPEIDALVISHDHYDHLDYLTVRLLKKKVKRVIVPIGVGSHFRKWGFEAGMITELNWHDSIRLGDVVTITATPAHHRSNRGFAQRKTLWASYVIEADGYKIYFSGDTGYSRHFKLIGEQYGPFDLALMECGQYNSKWPHSHMFPWQTVRAAIDIRTKMTLPVHWGKFAESEHPWNESVEWLLRSADSLQLPVTVPMIGEPYAVGDRPTLINWWKE